jgi:anti-sigma regulatory factor (Ser/Thr protein kinase)
VTFAAGRNVAALTAGFRHEAFFYRSDAECVAGVLAFLDDGIGVGERALVVAPEATSGAVAAQLGAASAVRFEDATRLALNPARLIPTVSSFLDQSDEDHGIRVVLQPLWPGRSRGELDEVILHEALANVAFAGQAVSMLCPYEVSALADDMAAHLVRTHPEIVAGGDTRASTGFAEPSIVIDAEAWPLPPAPPRSVSMALSRIMLPRARQFVRGHATTAGLAPDRVGDLILAVNELATNSLVHGPGDGVLRAWARAGEVVCEVADTGRISDPLAGRRPPSEEAECRRGLWMVNQICDLVELRSGASGTRVRLHMTCG